MGRSDLILLESFVYLMSVQFYAREAVSLVDSNDDIDLMYIHDSPQRSR